MFSFIIADLPFGISIIKILLHLLNFAILAVGLTFLLYKPVLKFIRKRQADIQEGFDKGEKLQAEAEEKKAEYDKLIAEADTEAEERKQAAIAEGEVRAKETVEKAEEEARRIRDAANREAEDLKKAAVLDVKDQIAATVVMLTEEILDRELSKEDNERIISKRLDEWKGEKK